MCRYALRIFHKPGHICTYFIILTNILDKCKQEIPETMLKARDAKYSILVRYGKVFFVEQVLLVNLIFLTC